MTWGAAKEGSARASAVALSVGLVLVVACGGKATRDPTPAGTGGASNLTEGDASNLAEGSASSVGGGGASGLGAAGAESDAGQPQLISPTESLAWSWSECGRIAVAPEDSGRPVLSLSLSGDGAVLATVAGATGTLRAVGTPFSASTVLWTASQEGASHVDVARDGSMVALSGDVRHVYAVSDGRVISGDEGAAPGDTPCIGTELRFSPDGRFVAGKRYSTTVDVFETAAFAQVAQLETYGCGQGLAFSPDGRRLDTPEGSFDTNTFAPWAPITRPTVPPAAGFSNSLYVAISPDGSDKLFTRCADGGCSTGVGAITLHGGSHPSFSPEGHWLVSAGQLLHRPSGTLRTLDPDLAREAIFTPKGDIVIGENDGSLVYFCRRM